MPTFLRSLLLLPLLALLSLSSSFEVAAQKAPKAPKVAKKKSKRSAPPTNPSIPLPTGVAAPPAQVAPGGEYNEAQRMVLGQRETEEQRTSVIEARRSGKFIEVGGGVMFDSRSIIENLSRSFDHTEFISATRNLEGINNVKNIQTVLAVTDSALMQNDFHRKSTAAGKTLEMRQYIVPGLHQLATVKYEKWVTELGTELIVEQKGPGEWTITDSWGNVARVTTADVPCNNGVFHVINTPLTSKLKSQKELGDTDRNTDAKGLKNRTINPHKAEDQKEPSGKE